MYSDLIRPNLYLGDRDSCLASEIERNDIKHVIRIYWYGELVIPLDPYIKVFRIVEEDDEYTYISQYFDECYKFIESARNRGESVLVHCTAGISRSATIVISYLMKKENRSFEDAFDQVKRLRPVINPNAGFVAQLKA